ncbi:hypothetical protein PQQ52_14825 [Paraburkholderia sediminicola]|uniref:helix-turn-helix domain-containing protein n=1 Tax=Paraburkholderia sediminicola TaxID=458836 RepID=UPI0038BC7CC2
MPVSARSRDVRIGRKFATSAKIFSTCGYHGLTTELAGKALTTESEARDAAPAACIHSHFDTHHEAPCAQLPAWRDRLGHFLDVPISRWQLADGLNGAIESYKAADLTFMDCRTDPVSQARSVARISTDSVRQFVFHVVVEGSIKAIIEIAYGVGFNSASDFNRAFRRAYEMSPSDFRALAR